MIWQSMVGGGGDRSSSDGHGNKDYDGMMMKMKEEDSTTTITEYNRSKKSFTTISHPRAPPRTMI